MSKIKLQLTYFAISVSLITALTTKKPGINGGFSWGNVVPGLYASLNDIRSFACRVFTEISKCRQLDYCFSIEISEGTVSNKIRFVKI